MDELALIMDLHRDGARQGPGGIDETRLAIALSGLSGKRNLRIADIGCGTGASTRVLALDLDARLTAVDFLPEFLDRLSKAADHNGLRDRIETVHASMDTLPFDEQSFDAIWSEGAIYNIGFEAGAKAWRSYLKPDGILAVSELTWLTGNRPHSLHEHWIKAYPEVDTASAKMAVLEANGYAPIGYFVLPERCWLENYYRPMQARFPDFLLRHGHAREANAIVKAEQAEIELYERYSAFFGYGFYVARRTSA
ncbi:MAG: class I SAM-dependent methyltransferase [Pseudomonadota bacterium]